LKLYESVDDFKSDSALKAFRDNVLGIVVFVIMLAGTPKTETITCNIEQTRTMHICHCTSWDLQLLGICYP